MPYSKFFSRHERVMLQFSAGKDSAACLRLLRPWWEKLDVVWCCQGNSYPETEDYMASVAAQVPRFFVVRGEQPDWVKAHGYPVDVLPLLETGFGAAIKGSSDQKFQPFWECCGHNSWEPMRLAVIRGGYTGVIRGQKAADHLKSPTTSGTVVAGVEYFFPLESWTDEQVLAFLGEKVPPSYKRGIPSSLDCADCTAYVADNGKRVEDLKQTSPRNYAKVIEIHSQLRTKLLQHVSLLGA